MVPGQPETYGISKRLPDDERKRLRRVLEGLRPPDAGLIVRTAAEGATDVELRRDVERLRAQWEQISKVAARTKAPSLVYQEPTLVVRVIREEFTKEYRGVVIDDRDLYEEVRGYVEAIAPELAERSSTTTRRKKGSRCTSACRSERLHSAPTGKRSYSGKPFFLRVVVLDPFGELGCDRLDVAAHLLV